MTAVMGEAILADGNFDRQEFATNGEESGWHEMMRTSK